jgi:hypothetical protein
MQHAVSCLLMPGVASSCKQQRQGLGGCHDISGRLSLLSLLHNVGTTQQYVTPNTNV